MNNIERLKRAKADRLEAEADERIREVQRLLGISRDVKCRHCEEVISIFGHDEDCLLRRINPVELAKEMKIAKKEHNKNINRQRIFKSSEKRWSGMPGSKQKTLVRRRRSKNRGPGRELRRCQVCGKQTLFLNQAGTWICNVCEHNKPCVYIPNGKNCQTCH